MDTHIDEWLVWLRAADLAAETRRVRELQIRRTAAVLDLDAATTDVLAGYIAGIQGSAWSKAGYLAALRGYFRWMHVAGHREDDPAATLPRVRTPKGVPRPVPLDVLQAALRDAAPDVALMLRLGAFAGLRRSEIASLHADNVSDTHLTITGKGRKVRRIPVHPSLRGLLPTSGWAFPSPVRPDWHIHGDTVWRKVKAALEDAYGPHALRHSAATRWYRATKDIRAVQELLGHESPTTTARYAGVEDDALTATVRAIA